MKQSTFAAYMLILENHVLPVFGEGDELSEKRVQAFVLDKLNGGLSAKSVKDILIVLKMVMKFGVKNGWMRHCEWDIKYPTAQAAKEVEVLTVQNHRKILNYIHDNFTFLMKRTVEKKIFQKMENEMKTFEHEMLGSLRCMMDEQGEPWFVAADVAKGMGYKLSTDMLRMLDEDEKGMRLMHTLGGNQRQTVISESGFYHAALRSHKPKAKPFRRWVTHEVLPQIRRTGGYVPLRDGATGELLDKLAMMERTRQLLQNSLDERDRQLASRERQLALCNQQLAMSDRLLVENEAQLEERDRQLSLRDRQLCALRPKARYCEQVLVSRDCLTTTQVAKGLGMTAPELNRRLCALGIQYRQSGQYMLYAAYANSGAQEKYLLLGHAPTTNISPEPRNLSFRLFLRNLFPRNLSFEISPRRNPPRRPPEH